MSPLILYISLSFSLFLGFLKVDWSQLKWLPSDGFYEGFKERCRLKASLYTIKMWTVFSCQDQTTKARWGENNAKSILPSWLNHCPNSRLSFTAVKSFALSRGYFRTWAQPNNIIIDHSSAHTPYSKAAADDLHHIIKNLQWQDSEAFSNHV